MKRNIALFMACLLASLSLDAGQFGTGFAINAKGYLVTCHHVVKNAERVIVHVSGGYLEASIVMLDPRNDLALLKVPQWSGSYLGLVSSSEVTHASDVLAAGFPDPSILGVNPKISTGIVNALSGVRDDPRYIQISAPVQPGNSGGPLLSNSGRVVGVVAAGLNSIDRMENGGYLPQTVNYAIKTDLIFPLLKNASVSVPKFGNRTPSGQKQIERTLGAIALIEGLGRGEGMLFKGTPIATSPRPVAPKPAPALPHQTSFKRQAVIPASLSSNQAKAGPWVFPDSHLRLLSVNEVKRVPREALWRARNEIYVRRGFIFPNQEGQRFASEFGPNYRPMTPSIEAIQSQLSPVEIANLKLIANYE